MTGYQSKKKAAIAKTIDEVNLVDHEPDGRRAAQKFIEAENKKVSNRYGYVPKLHPSEWQDKLAQPAQEPVGEVTENTDNGFKCEFNQRLTAGTKLYTSTQRPWVGLTEKEKKEIYRLSVYVEGAISLTEAKLKEKNNGA